MENNSCLLQQQFFYTQPAAKVMEMKRGRPVQSDIRQNMVEILFYLGEAYGYQIYKVYKKVYPPVTLRSMYYHLKKGTQLGEFQKLRVEKDQGEYSWGPSTERIIYKLGPDAKPRGDSRVQEYLDAQDDE